MVARQGRGAGIGGGGARRLVCLVLVGLLVVGACSDDDTGDAGPGPGGGADSTVAVALGGVPDTWNPSTAVDPGPVLGVLVEQVYPDVFRVRPDLSLALDTSLMVSADLVGSNPQIVEYVIRPEAVWSDGVPITGADFELMWARMRGADPTVEVAYTQGYEDIGAIETSEDGKTVTVRFSRPYGDWRRLFSDLLPAHIVATVEDWNHGLDGTRLPTFSGGPFLLSDLEPGERVRLVRNDAWWGDPPGVGEIVVRLGVAPGAVPRMLRDGEVHAASPSPQLRLVDDLEGIDGTEVATGPGVRFENLVFNLRNPHLARRRVRRAIALALDRGDLAARTIRYIDPEAGRLENRIFSPVQEAYEAHARRYRDSRVDAAVAELRQAGYVRGDDGVFAREGERLVLRLTTASGNDLREEVQELVVDQLAEVGIEVRIDNVAGSAAFERFFPRSNLLADQDFDVALFGWLGSPYPSTLEPLYTSDGTFVGSNPAGYHRAEVADMFREAASQLTGAAATYNEIDRLLWEDLPTLPLFTVPPLAVHRTELTGVAPSGAEGGLLWNAHEWRLTE